METPLVTVIVPVYKTKAYLEQCVQSICNQSYAQLEIILVDDGSTEDMRKKSQRLRAILDKPLYQEAFAQLDTSYCDAKWTLFFLLCKTRRTFLLVALLEIINYLRSRTAA